MIIKKNITNFYITVYRKDTKMNYAKNVTELIGNTPLVQLQESSNRSGATVLGKCEFMNPTHSVKDRIGTNMI